MKQFENIEEHILKSREERRKHLNLQEGCINIGGSSTKLQGLLAYFLGAVSPSGKAGGC